MFPSLPPFSEDLQHSPARYPGAARVGNELAIDELQTPGDEVLITIPSKPGTYVMYCTPHSDPDNPEVPQGTEADDGDMAARFVVT